jgi:hypothetical protein
VPEEVTVGELMAEIRDAGGEVLPRHLARLDRALAAVDALADDIPVVLLDLPDAALRARSLHHATRPGAAAALAAFYGSQPEKSLA